MIRPCLAVFMLVALSSSAFSTQCRTFHDCVDGNPATLDFCLPGGKCVNAITKDPSISMRQDAPQPPDEPVFEVLTREELLGKANAEVIPLSDRKKFLDIVASLAKDLNPHRFLHLNVLKFDPAEAFEKLSTRLDTENVTNVEFLFAVRHIFQQMDDRHTTFVLPGPLVISGAVLGFSVSPFYEPGGGEFVQEPAARFVVTAVNPAINASESFVKGVEVLTWNGLPVIDVVENLGVDSYASNKFARRQRGISLLTAREFSLDGLPEEEVVVITYRSLNGVEKTLVTPWIYIMLKQVPEVRLEKQSMHKDPSPQLGLLPRTPVRLISNRTVIPVNESTGATSFEAEIIETSSGPIGRISLGAFPQATVPSLAEYARVISLMPSNGLIIDIRGNDGGDPDTVNALMELVSNIDVPDISFNIRATNLTKRLFLAPNEVVSDNPIIRSLHERIFRPFQSALRDTLALGEMFTGPGGGFLTSLGKTRTPQVYDGPIIVVCDARTYSGGDIMAAYAVDTGVAELVGVGNATGGGGAGTISYSTLQQVFPTLLEPLPVGAVATSFTRFYRTGERAGSLVESVGVTPDVVYYPSLDDVLREDCDLFEFLAERLTTGGAAESPEPSIGPDESSLLSVV